jgi:hypothetical protein
MAGRFAYFLIAGGAIVGGAILQGDISFNPDRHDVRVARAVISGDERAIERSFDRAIDRETIAVRGKDDRTDGDLDPATKRALSGAVAELVRAEASLISAKLDDGMPESALKQIEQRRDIARQAVERLADDAKASSQSDRDALREDIRESVRAAVRS